MHDQDKGLQVRYELGRWNTVVEPIGPGEGRHFTSQSPAQGRYLCIPLDDPHAPEIVEAAAAAYRFDRPRLSVDLTNLANDLRTKQGA